MFPHFFPLVRPLRVWLLASASAAALVAVPLAASARDLLPEKPSVEVNLDALQDLRPQAPAAYAPAPPAQSAPGGSSYQPAARQVPVQQPLAAPAAAVRQIPAEQPVPGYHVPPAAAPAYTPPAAAPTPSLPPKSATEKTRKKAKTEHLAPLPAAPVPAIALPAAAAPPPAPAPLPAAKPAPLPVPVKQTPPVALPLPVPKPPVAAVPPALIPVETKPAALPTTPPPAKPQPNLPPPPPLTLPSAPSLPLPELKLPPQKQAAPASPPPTMPAPVAAPIAPPTPLPPVVYPSAAPKPDPLPAPVPAKPTSKPEAKKPSIAKPETVKTETIASPPVAVLPPIHEVIPKPALPVPAAKAVPQKPPVPASPAAPPVPFVTTPDISKLDFSQLPAANPAPMPKPAPAPAPLAQPPVAAKPAAAAANVAPPPLPPIAPVVPPPAALPLPEAPQASAKPPLILVPAAPEEKKPEAPLPPSVTERMGKIFGATPEKEGTISDTTTIKKPNIALLKEVQAERARQEAGGKPDLNAAQDAVKSGLPPLVEPPKLPPAEKKFVDLSATDKDSINATDKTKPFAAPLPLPPLLPKTDTKKESSENLPPAELPPATPLANDNGGLTPGRAITLPKTEIAPAPKFDEKPALALPLPKELPKPPVVPPIIEKTDEAKKDEPAASGLPKLPGLEVADKPARKPLPSLAAITGEKQISNAPAKPFEAANPPPAPGLPKLLNENDGPVVKRELPEVKVGSDTVPPKQTSPEVKITKKEKPDKIAKPVPNEKSPEKSAPVKAEAAAVDTVNAAPLQPPEPAAPVAQPPLPLPLPPLKADAASAAPAAAVAPKTAPIANETKLIRSLEFDKDQRGLTEDAKSDLLDVAEKAKNTQGIIRVVAYASGTPEQAAIARQISLSRAQAIRAFLISKGVNQLVIVPQALGNKVPSGNADRADIFMKE